MKYKLNPLAHSLRFFQTDERLHVTLETTRLLIRSVLPSDKNDCISLHTDKEVMAKYGYGIPYDEETIQLNLQSWLVNWQQKNPFNRYAIFEKSTNTFIGIISLEPAKKGVSEISYLIHQSFWGQGYMKEAAIAAVQTLIPRLMLRNYHIDYHPVTRLIATARTDNYASQHILEGLGLKKEALVFRYGASRFCYNLFTKSMRNDYQRFFTHQDKQKLQAKALEKIEEDAEIKAEEMANSAFGRKNPSTSIHF